MKVEITNRFKRFNPDGPDMLMLHVIWCKNCCGIFAVKTWDKDTPCPLCNDNAIKDYETGDYVDWNIRGGERIE